jgi:sugar lactone lactonase YvrE
VKPDGTYAGFISVGRAPTNCAFVGSELYVTDGGHLGMSATPEMAGALWRVSLDDAAGLDLFQGHVGGREQTASPDFDARRPERP